MLNKSDPSYQGVAWSEAARPLGPIAYPLHARTVSLRDLGAALSPFNAFQLLQGVETLPLRMPRHCENTAKIAAYLQTRSDVVRIIHTSVQTGVEAERALLYLTGGLLGFELTGGRETQRRFIDALELFCHVANIGDARSLARPPVRSYPKANRRPLA